MKRVITFGTFDLLHMGHVRILEKAREYGDHLVVGISSDDLNFHKKAKRPVFGEIERMSIVKALRCVDDVFLEESLELKLEYIKMQDAKILVMGDDWTGRFDYCQSLCEVIYLPRTPSVSTTAIIEKIRC